MSGDIDMSGNEIVGLDDPSDDSSATSKKYVDDEIAKVGGGLDQATADNRYLKKTDAVTTYETQTNVNNNYLKKTDATNKYLTQNDATNTYLSKIDATMLPARMLPQMLCIQSLSLTPSTRGKVRQVDLP